MESDILIPPADPAAFCGYEVATAYVDGCCKGNPGVSGVGASFLNEQGEEFYTVCADVGLGTNNQAEYKAILRAMWHAYYLGIKQLTIYSDSMVAVNQISGRFVCRNSELQTLHRVAMMFLCRFERVMVLYTPRERNVRADRLANEAIYRTDVEGRRAPLLHCSAA